MKIVLLVLAVVVGLLVVLEVGLRSLFGFGNPPLYVADEKIGYLLAPNQNTRRFGNRIQINQYSMRSQTITPTRPDRTLRVLLLGDSIANGGWWTDQVDTLSAMMTRQLQSNLTDTSFQQVEVLNASANSWSPRNELAYLQRFGTFDAQVIVLLINTDDLFGTAPTSIQVGRDRNYPVRKPPLALAEAFARYLLPEPSIPELQAVHSEKGDRVGFNLEAIREIKAIADAGNAEFLLAMTPLLRETGQPGPRDYEVVARQRLTEFTKEHQIDYIDFLPMFNNTQPPESLYRDTIHLSTPGNQLVSETIGRKLYSAIGILDSTK